MEGRRGLYLILFAVVLLFGAVQSVFAQEPELSSTPQRVAGGVVEQDTTANTQAELPLRLQSPIFRDTLPFSRVAAISVVVPGFSQLYNNQYWKIPVLYGSVGALSYLTINANKKFQQYSRQYDFLLTEYHAMKDGTDKTQFLHEQIDPVRTRMVRYNTQRTIYFTGAALTYFYFLADGVMNYPNQTTSVKRATTLAMMFPGAGQFYNKSYWKVPIVLGAFATMGYLIDWNSRGYQRYRTAYNQFPDNEFKSRSNPPSQTQLKNWRDNFRRNRDLCIIITAGAYLLSVVEAHVDAHLKDFDVSDDLSLRVEPTMIDMSSYMSDQNTGYPGVGLSMKLNF